MGRDRLHQTLYSFVCTNRNTLCTPQDDDLADAIQEAKNLNEFSQVMASAPLDTSEKKQQGLSELPNLRSATCDIVREKARAAANQRRQQASKTSSNSVFLAMRQTLQRQRQLLIEKDAEIMRLRAELMSLRMGGRRGSTG